MTELDEMDDEVVAFLMEAEENFGLVEQDLVELEQNPQDEELVNSIFRNIHTVKGSSGFLGYKTIESLCHRGESILDKVRSHEIECTSELITILLKIVDGVNSELTKINEGVTEDSQESYMELLSQADELIK